MSTKHILTAVLAEVEMTPVPAKMAVTDHLQVAVDTVSRSVKQLIRHAAANPSPAPNVPTERNPDKYAANLHKAIAERMCMSPLCISFVGVVSPCPVLVCGFVSGIWF